ncbi:unnamed protein product [Brassica oleracea var. botrytis]
MPTYPYMLLDYMLNLADSWKDSSDSRITIGKCSSKEQKHIEINTSDITADVRNVMSIGYYIGALKVGMLEKEYLTSTNNVRLYIYYKPTDDTSKTGSTTSSTLGLRDPKHCHKDQRFYVPTPGSDYFYSLDPNSKENDHPEFVDMFPDYLPEEHLDHDVDEMNSCATTVHFVEAASGEQFFVKCFFKDQLEIDDKGLEQVTRRTRQFMVFRAEDHPRIEEHRKELLYTEDTGDFCIFLGQGEPFCVRASMHPGLRANYIYFSGYNFGAYDITNRCCIANLHESKLNYTQQKLNKNLPNLFHQEYQNRHVPQGVKLGPPSSFDEI